MKITGLIILALFHYSVAFAENGRPSQEKQKQFKNETAVLEIQISESINKRHAKIETSPKDYIGKREYEVVNLDLSKGYVKLPLKIGGLTYIYIDSVTRDNQSFWFLIRPGDQVKVLSDGKKLRFSGKGAERFELMYRLDSLLRVSPIVKNKKDYTTVSLEDFFEWNLYLDKLTEDIIALTDWYKTKLLPLDFIFIRAKFLDNIINTRSDKFSSLEGFVKEKGLGNKFLCRMYDSIYAPSTESLFKYVSANLYGNYKPIVYNVIRSHSFNLVEGGISFRMQVLNAGLKVYKGVLREKFIVEYFAEKILKSEGFVPETEKFLVNYYKEKSFPEYKAFVKSEALRIRKLVMGNQAPEFTLTDIEGNAFVKEKLKGKVAVLDFWFTGCAGCVQMAPALRKVEEKFKADTNVVFLSISIDQNKDRWIKSIEQKKYTTGGGVNLYTGGLGDKHNMIKEYAVEGYPTILIMDAQGKIITTFPKPDPRNDEGAALIALIKNTKDKQVRDDIASRVKQVRDSIASGFDGPYVFLDANSSSAYFIENKTVKKESINNPFSVKTDLAEQVFPVTLKGKHLTEPALYERPDKVFALSDIEGNFDAFRKLLQGNNIIDENFNWTFGKGHLVFAGDMFDRGQQVTECLWLIYSLEEKAKAAGGYIHFVLGNHEIMNLYGDHSYAQQKYKDNATMMSKSLTDLYNENSELGRWLRTKNIVEKLGDLLFAHAGISLPVMRSAMTIQDMNDLARPYYASKNIDSTNKNLMLLYGSQRVGYERSATSPFWYRGYWGDGDIDNIYEVPSMQQVDSVLQKYDVKHIITGHTVFADTISLRFNGKTINTDTKHKDGKSEALLIEGDRYYRVNQEGRRVLLFVDEKKKK